MAKRSLIAQVARKDVDKEKIADKVIKYPDLLSEIMEGQRAQKADIKYGCAKVIRIVSEREPALLYPQIDTFIELLDGDNNILKWQGIRVIGNLATVDTRAKIDKILDEYLAPIAGPVLITAANVIGAAAQVALAKPKLSKKIVRRLLKVEEAEYQTPECRNVALGHAIVAFDQFFDQVERKQPIIGLVERQLDNPRPATRKKAEKFLKKWRCQSTKRNE